MIRCVYLNEKHRVAIGGKLKKEIDPRSSLLQCYVVIAITN